MFGAISAISLMLLLFLVLCFMFRILAITVTLPILVYLLYLVGVNNILEKEETVEWISEKFADVVNDSITFCVG